MADAADSKSVEKSCGFKSHHLYHTDFFSGTNGLNNKKERSVKKTKVIFDKKIMNTNIKFVVNEEKRTVVAIANDCSCDVVRELEKADNSSHILLTTPIMFDMDERMLILDTFIGVAKCHPNDVFSAKEGKKVAARKMHKAYNKAKRNAMKAYMTRLSRFLENLEKSTEKVEYRINK